MVKLHKWKYQDKKKIFLSHKKMYKFLRKNSVTIYDTRSSYKFYNYHFRGAINVSPIQIKSVILNHLTKSKIVLIHDFERANMAVASWARYNGYRKIFLFKITNNVQESIWLKFNDFA